MTQRYTHLSDDYLADATEVMNKQFAGNDRGLANSVNSFGDLNFEPSSIYYPRPSVFRRMQDILF